MKKALSVLVIAILALGAVFADDPAVVSPKNLIFEYVVSGGLTPDYRFTMGEGGIGTGDTETGVKFHVGDATGGIIAGTQTFHLWDYSVFNDSADKTMTITFGTPSNWTKSSDISELATGPTLGTYEVKNSDSPTVEVVAVEGPDGFKVVYKANATVNRASAATAVEIGSFVLSWVDEACAADTYTSTVAVTYAGP